jgi:DNA-binding IclR family transcriptional regulator
MLQALKRAHVLDQDPETRRYRLGWRVRVMAAGAGDQVLVRAARPLLQTLVARTGEVALLSVQEANRSLTVMREESQNSLRGGGWLGAVPRCITPPRGARSCSTPTTNSWRR